MLVLVALVTACSAPAARSAGDATASAAATTAPAGAPDVPAMLVCLGDLPRGASAHEGVASSQGRAVTIDVPRPDLPKKANRITAFELPDPAAATRFAPSAAAFLGATGGTAVPVGKWVVGNLFGGDADVEAVVRRCAGAG